MKRLFSGVFAFLLVLASGLSFAEEPFASVKAIVGRLAGGYNGAAQSGDDSAKANVALEKFTFAELSDASERATFGPNATDDGILIKATSSRAAAYALGKYLRDCAKGHVSWCGSRIPSEWVIPTETVDATPPYEVTVAYNYCTLAYTMAFWGKSEWRAEIDRLALLGFNVALVEAGLPRVWQLTLSEMGFSDEQIKAFIPDEAAQPWWNMGNLERLGGPLTDARIAADADLGKYIATEMRKLGIEPILQGFVGLVPTFAQAVLDTRYSQADDAHYVFVDQGNWCQGVKRPILLSPRSQAFRDFAAAWYKNLAAVYGFQPKYLGGDLFHEGGKAGSLDIPACATAVQTAQQTAFPGVTWVLQSWQGSPEQGVQNGVDPAYTLVEALDMNMANTGAFNTGYKRNYKNQTTGEYLPWVWVEVMNFGGNTGMYGGMKRFSNLNAVATGSGIDAGSSAVFKGYGNLSEGFETNPAVYDLYMRAFMRAKADAAVAASDWPAWFRAYQERRWGHTDDALVAAYGTLATTVWDSNTFAKQQGVIENILCASPSFTAKKTSQWGPEYAALPYDPAALYPVARTFLATMAAHPELVSEETFRYDMVEFFAQLLADRARVILSDCATSGSKRTQFLKLIDLSEKILACSDGFRLDAKENRTKSVAGDAGVAAYRRMVTTWMGSYATGQATQLHEYAHRAYAGLMKDYYRKRWEAFFAKASGEMSDAAYTALLTDLDDTFPSATLTPTANGDLAAIANEILLYLDPPAYTWTGAAGNNLWDTGVNWTFQDAAATWANENNAVVETGADRTINATAPVSVLDLEVRKPATRPMEDVAGCGGTTVIQTTPVTVFKDAKLADMDDGWTFSAKMGGGGWFGTPARTQDATACDIKSVVENGKITAVTAQFQCVDDGWLKAVVIKFSQSGDDIVAVATDVYGKYNTALGTILTASVGTSPTVDAYPLYGINAKRPAATSLTLGADIALTGVVTVKDTLKLAAADQIVGATALVLERGTLDLTGVSARARAASSVTLPAVEVSEAGTIKVADNTVLTLASVDTDGSVLRIEGPAATVNASDSTVTVVTQTPVSARRVAYVCTDSGAATYDVPQPLELTEGGYLVPAAEVHTDNQYLTEKPITLDWDLTLDQLAEMEFSCEMTGGWMGGNKPTAYGCKITKNAADVTLQLQAKDVSSTFTGIKGTVLTLTPANRKVTAVITKAKAVSNGDWGVADCSGGSTAVVSNETDNGYAFRNLNAVARKAEITSVQANFEHIDTALAQTAITTAKNVKLVASDLCSTKAGGSAVVTVAEGATLTLGADSFAAAKIVLAGALAGSATLTVPAIETAADKDLGSCVLSGAVAKTGAGQLTAVLAPEASVTVVAGAVSLTSADPEYEIVTEGNVHTCSAIYYVAAVGEERVDTGWTMYRTYKEALAAVGAGECVYVLDDTCIPEGTEITSGPAGSYLTVKEGYIVDAEGNVVPGEVAPEQITAYYVSGYFGVPANEADALTLVNADGSAVVYNGQTAEWTIVIDDAHLKSGTVAAWCAEQSQYGSYPINVVKIVVNTNFDLRPGDTKVLMDGVEFEVAKDVTLNLNNTQSGGRTFNLGAATFSGEGTVNATSGVAFTKDIVITGDVKVNTPANAFVAKVGEDKFLTLAGAIAAAMPDGLVEVLDNSLAGGNIPDDWRGTVQFSGTMPAGFNPANYGNAQSTIEFKGVSGGYLSSTSLSYAGTLKLTNDGDTPAWTAQNGFSDVKYNFTFGALSGDGDFVDNGGANQQYSFADASTFAGNVTVLTKRFVIGSAGHDKVSRIYVEKGAVANIAAGKTWDGQWAVRIDGTVKGSGTLSSAKQKQIYFGYEPNVGAIDAADPVIDLADGALTVASDCGVTFGKTLTLKNVTEGAVVLKCATMPTNLGSVQLKDETGAVRSDWKLVYRDGAVRLGRTGPMTLYWNDWRGTFWETAGGTDVHGNRGLGRDANGYVQEILPNDTVVFDKAHYQKDGVFAEQTDYWHYDENLYIKDEVQPGTSNDWDLKILEGVTLKMGLRGAKATGQNVISDLKIYVEEGSSLELGYWGNTHHYQGVIRDDVVFGGSGTIRFGADLGPSLRAEGDVLVKGGETPTMDLNGKELVLSGANASIEVNLTGFGAVTPTAAGIHLKGDVDFGNAATIDASTEANRVTLDKSATFGANLTVKLTQAPTEGNPVKILALGAGATASFTDTAVRVLVGGQPVAAFYELFTDGDGDLAVRVKERQVAYGTATGAGYDFAGALVTVTMDPAIEDLPIAVTVGDRVWTGTMGADGTGVVMVGDEDTLLPSGTYAYTVTVGANAYTGNGTLFIGDTWFKADPSSGASEEIGGAWQTAAPAIVAGKYSLTDTATFTVSADKAADARGVIEQMLSFDGPMADADLAALDMTDAKGALTLAEDASGALCWKGYVGGAWVGLSTTVPAELGEHRVRIEYDRTTANGTLQYFIDGVAASEPFAAAGAMTSVSYVGAGTLSELEGFVEDSALVAYAGVKYKSMEDAVTAWKAADKAGAITLLTNIYFAPEPDTYYIEKNDYSLYFTNDMVIQSETKNGDISTIVVGWPVAVVGYHAGSEDFPIVIDGEWLGHTIPWKRHSLIQQELLKTPLDSDFALWQAYALGFTPEEVSTAKAIARFATEGSTVYITDALPVRDADETGIVVTRLLMEGDASGTVKVLDEQPEATERGLPIDVTTGGRVRCFKLGYEFEADVGER